MSYIVMARKWRPQTFQDMVGQEAIVQTLKNALQANRISHAYLFTGPRGVGKTTAARLLAKAVNCLAPVQGEPCNHCARCEEILSGASTDVLEIDAASNGLVDDARELREKVRYAPLTCRYKVLIIDEVHMMSNAAFNALLKTLEEPPAHTIFILATTEAHKVPATIVSRCQRFDFRRIPLKTIMERLSLMALPEGITADEESLHLVARAADGSLRDAQSLFDQVVSFSGNAVAGKDVASILGLVETQVFVDLVDAIAGQDAPRALEQLDRLVNSGADLRQFMKEWVEYWRSLILARMAPAQAGGVLNLASHVWEAVQRQSKLFPLEELLQIGRLAAATDDEQRRSQHPRLLLELLLIQLCLAERVVSLEALWQEVSALERRLQKMPEAGLITATEKSLVLPPAAIESSAPAEAQAPDDPAGVSAQAESGEPVLAVNSLEEAAPDTPLSRVRRFWPDLLQAVGGKNRRVQGLLRDAEPLAADEGCLEIGCASAYHLTGLQKEESRKVIEEELKILLGHPMRLKARLSGNAAAENEAKSQEPDLEEIARREPLVQKTLELFGGRVVEIIPNKPAKNQK